MDARTEFPPPGTGALQPGLSGEAVAALHAHPRFGEAVRVAAGGLAELYHGNRLLNLLVSDRGRLLIGYFALYLHFDSGPSDRMGGLTPTRLQDLCAENDVCSRGRAAAILALMRGTGCLAAAPRGGDRRRHRLAPTERFVDAQRQRWRCVFRAIALLLPDGSDALRAVERTDFIRAFIRRLGKHFQVGVRVLAGAPDLRLFAERNAGMMILFSLLAAGPINEAEPRVVSISISALARRFGVSRAHILKLLRDAASRGLLRRAGGEEEGIIVLPPLTDAAERFFATVFLFFAHCAREALTEIGAMSSASLSAP